LERLRERPPQAGIFPLQEPVLLPGLALQGPQRISRQQDKRLLPERVPRSTLELSPLQERL
jgi:hypothetical protein